VRIVLLATNLVAVCVCELVPDFNMSVIKAVFINTNEMK